MSVASRPAVSANCGCRLAGIWVNPVSIVVVDAASFFIAVSRETSHKRQIQVSVFLIMICMHVTVLPHIISCLCLHDVASDGVRLF